MYDDKAHHDVFESQPSETLYQLLLLVDEDLHPTSNHSLKRILWERHRKGEEVEFSTI
jgi:hypothetical protein